MNAHRHSHTSGHGPGPREEEMLQRTIEAYGKRFGPPFWEIFSADVAPRLPGQPVIVDLACGSGLLLQAMGRRLPGARLHGYDVSPVMLRHARSLDYGDRRPTLRRIDLAAQRVPLPDAQAHLVTMTLALHHFDDPVALLRQIRRVLAPGGMFVLCEWERTSLQEYLERWELRLDTADGDGRTRAFQHYAMTCRFTADDWRFLLSHTGFAVGRTAELDRPLLVFLSAAAPTPAGVRAG